jgi:hypothetical protein
LAGLRLLTRRRTALTVRRSIAGHLGQLVHRRAVLVAGDQLLDLVIAESPGTPGSVGAIIGESPWVLLGRSANRFEQANGTH